MSKKHLSLIDDVCLKIEEVESVVCLQLLFDLHKDGFSEPGMERIIDGMPCYLIERQILAISELKKSCEKCFEYIKKNN